jgi:YebC/PmpR family DNA-binding regulatory protein
MAGHSHWANIKHKKAANDAKKAKVITQMGRLIKGAIAVGGNDPEFNPRLRLAIQKARAMNMTRDAIDRAIQRSSGENAKPMEELTYEGYGAGGVAVVVESMTDNRNRTAPELRKLFERGGGSLGAPGCVAWQFHDKSVFSVAESDEDAVMEALLMADADADEILADASGQVSITAAQDQYDIIRKALEEAGLEIVHSDLTKIAENPCEVDDLEVAQRIQKLLDMLEDHDDITGVHTNFAPTDAVLAEL